MAKPLNPSGPSVLTRLDGRIKILLMLASCLFTQYLPPRYYPIWLAVLLCLFANKEMRTVRIRQMARGGIWFILFWLAVKSVSDYFGGATPTAAFLGAAPFALRLAALTLIGMAFTAFSSPPEIGRAVAWYIRPVAGKHAWKPAVVVSLTAWFLPQALRLPAQVAEAVRARGIALPWWRKIVIIAGTTLRILRRQADAAAIGLASRRLDQDTAWR
ncbi:MAG: energy-coupling factor transporter transmembrane protein EcfT [Planctomycetes bacterium]|nr:energy-coupling factor transporter transmembrane protein EcfT [Planctomycetota bacterium]